MAGVTVAAIMLVRDEADIIGPVLQHLHQQGIHNVLAWDNMSEDATPEILELYGCHVILDEDPVHDHARKSTKQAHQANALFGADWILPVDADEVFYWPDGTLVDYFDQCDAEIAVGTGWDHLVTDDDDPTQANPLRRITRRRRAPQPLHKIAYRYHPNLSCTQGNHLEADTPGTRADGLRYRHFQYRSYEQMQRKVRDGLEAIVPVGIPYYCDHWRKDAALTDDELWRKWRRLCEEPGLIEDPCP